MNEGILDTSDYVRVVNNTGMDIKGCLLYTSDAADE